MLLIGQTLASLTTAAISVAAPAVSQHLQLTGGSLQLVVSGYGLTFTSLLVTGARLGDRGYRRSFLIGVALFTLAGLLSGIAPGMAVLTIGQLLQGAGAALLIPQVLSLIQLRFAGKARSRAISLYSMTLGYGVALGLVLGGALAGSNIAGLTWRPVFLINVPIGIVLLVVGWKWLPTGGSGSTSRQDLRGAVVFMLACACVVIGLAFGPAAGWPRWTWWVIVLGSLGFVVFIFLERGLRDRDPLLDFRALREPGVVPGLVVVLVLMGGYGTLLYTASAYMQDGLGFGVLKSGLVFSAYAIGFGTINLTWARPARGLHRWVSPVGIGALCAVEFALAGQADSTFELSVVIPLLVVAGIGHGAGFGALVDRVAANTPPHRSSAFSGLVNTVTQMAILIGIAAIGGLYLAAARVGGAEGHATAMSEVFFVLGAVGLVALVCSAYVSVRLPDTESPGPPAH